MRLSFLSIQILKRMINELGDSIQACAALASTLFQNSSIHRPFPKSDQLMLMGYRTLAVS
ncbi:hypothetical protein MJD09_06265 [bacterium]|nr:hypothetical protein [bacterium]